MPADGRDPGYLDTLIVLIPVVILTRPPVFCNFPFYLRASMASYNLFVAVYVRRNCCKRYMLVPCTITLIKKVFVRIIRRALVWLVVIVYKYPHRSYARSRSSLGSTSQSSASWPGRPWGRRLQQEPWNSPRPWWQTLHILRWMNTLLGRPTARAQSWW